MLKDKKLEGQEQASGSKGLEEICGDTMTFDNSGNGGMNKTWDTSSLKRFRARPLARLRK